MSNIDVTISVVTIILSSSFLFIRCAPTTKQQGCVIDWVVGAFV